MGDTDETQGPAVGNPQGRKRRQSCDSNPGTTRDLPGSILPRGLKRAYWGIFEKRVYRGIHTGGLQSEIRVLLGQRRPAPALAPHAHAVCVPCLDAAGMP